jgi:UDPglucose 6-dehydrogenase
MRLDDTMPPHAKVTIVGLWHQGVVAAACLADWGIRVVGFDADAELVGDLGQGRARVFEPGLDDLLKAGISSGRLSFSTRPDEAFEGAQFLLVMHDTPVDESDRSDLSGLFSDVERVVPYLEEDVIIHVTAQVPVGSCDALQAMVRGVRPGLNFTIAYSPENLRLGQAVERFRKPPLPVLGAADAQTIQKLESLYAGAGVQWHHCGIRTAEMLKHALNAFLAMSVTFGNELGNLCDELAVDGHRLAALLRLEPRVGAKAMLLPGLGFSGGTLARDLYSLRDFGDRLGVETPLLDGIWESNAIQNSMVSRRLFQKFGADLEGRRVCILGLTYKPDTSTLRRSAALELVEELVGKGLCVTAHDPKASRTELALVKGLVVFDSLVDAVRNSDAVVLMTPWQEYKSPDLGAIKRAMRGNLLFDTANFWSADDVGAAGFEYLNIGSGRLLKITP